MAEVVTFDCDRDECSFQTESPSELQEHLMGHVRYNHAYERGVMAGRSTMAMLIEALWEREGGWIPGAAHKDLSAILGVPLKTSVEIQNRKERTREQLRTDG